MDSVNVFKGYGKVSQLESQSPNHNPTRKRLVTTTVAVAAILILTLTIGIAVAALARESNKEEALESLLLSNPAEAIKRVCRVTPHPDTCFSAVSSLNSTAKPDPEAIFKLALQAAVKDLSNASASVKKLNDLRSEAALRDCVSQFDEALSRLNDSAAAMEVDPGEKMLDEVKMKNIQTWISAAMTDQDTCLDGLEEMGSPVLDQFKIQLQSSKVSISNSLAIVAKMENLLEEFDLKLH